MRLRMLVIGSLMALSPPSVALAFDSEAGNPILDRFHIEAGSFYYGTGTTVTLNGTYGQRGVPIDLEHDLGFRDVNRFRLDAYWRITKHQRLRILYFQAERQATRSIDRTIQFGNATYPVNTTISARNKESIVALGYEYDFFVRDHVSIGANIGIHNLRFDLGLTGTASTNSGERTTEASQSASANGPLPLIGLAGIFRANSWLYFTTTVQGMKVAVNAYSGSLWDVGGTMVWQAFRHFGVGVGYDYFRLNASVDRNSYNGSLTWRYSGPRLFFSGSF